MADENRSGLTALGKTLSLLLIFLLIGLGVWIVLRDRGENAPAGDAAQTPQADTDEANGGDVPLPMVSFMQPEVPRLSPPQPYNVQNNTIEVELSEYAGYAGLIVANGGLAPNDDSFFAKNYGFRVNITLSEEEAWDRLNTGEMAASATTADALAVFGRQFDVVVPAQIGFSRGADGIVVRSGINRINQLKGQVLAASQFNEADFFIRYLAQEAGIEVKMLADSNDQPDPECINLLYCEDAFAAGDLFAEHIVAGGNKLAGCITWAPKTTEIVEALEGKARILTTNRNLLIVADVLIVNKAFAEQHPEMVRGLVHGLLEGNRMVRDNPEAHLDTLINAFNTLYPEDSEDRWDRESALDELSRVHLSNLPENLAFFSGEIDAAGSFGGIYASAMLAYGSMIRNPVDAEHFVRMDHLNALRDEGLFVDQKVAIAPVRTITERQSLEADPLLSKDIRFYFERDSADLDMQNQQNLDHLADIKQLLQVSPGSRVLLRGHVDNVRIPEFRQMGGEGFVRQKALEAVALSKARATEVQKQLIEQYGVDPARIETLGLGWEQPVEQITESDSPEEKARKSAANRRVEVYWYTLE